MKSSTFWFIHYLDSSIWYHILKATIQHIVQQYKELSLAQLVKGVRVHPGVHENLGA
jgi:hypothetical protein